MYKLTDDKGRLLVMRPDNTMPIARLTATRLQNAVLPVRLYYAQDVYHLNHGLTGRNDQQFQAGVELIGAAGMRADLEMLSLAAEAIRLFADGEDTSFRIEIGHIGFFNALIAALEVEGEVRDEIRELIESKNYAALSDKLDALPADETVNAIRRLPAAVRRGRGAGEGSDPLPEPGSRPGTGISAAGCINPSAGWGSGIR